MLSPDDLSALELDGVAVTAAVEADGTLRPIGGLWEKLGAQAMDLAHRRLLHTVVVAEGQDGVPPAYLREDDGPLRVIEARNIADAVRHLNDQGLPRRAVRQHERKACQYLEILDRRVPIQAHYQVLPLLLEVSPEQLPRDPRSSSRGRPKRAAL